MILRHPHLLQHPPRIHNAYYIIHNVVEPILYILIFVGVSVVSKFNILGIF